MKDKDFCLSSYMAYRYIWKDGMDFYEGFRHENFQAIPDEERIPVKTSEDIDREIQKQVNALYEKYDHIGIQKCTADDLVVILLHTRSLIAAAHTSDTRVHVHLTNVEHLDGVTVFFRSALEIIN